MTKRKRRALIWIGSILGIVAIAAAFIIANWDWNRAKGYIAAGVSKATGRELSINGDLKVDLGWISKVHMSQIQFGNASWSSHPKMADIGFLDAQIDLWQLLKGRFVLPEVSLSHVQLVLEKNRDGTANWEFPAAPSTPQKRTQVPVIEKLIINDGTLLFNNQETQTQLELKLSQADAAGFLAAPVTLTAKGYYQKQPLTLNLEGSSYQNLQSSTEPYPLKMDIRVGKLKANINGHLTEPLQMKGEDVTLDVEGDNMANLFPLIHVVFPSTSPYKLRGHLKHEGNVWSFSNFAGRVGGSDLAGTIRVDAGPKRPVMKADLVSNLLDFKDLAGFIGGDPNKSATSPAEESKIAAN